MILTKKLFKNLKEKEMKLNILYVLIIAVLFDCCSSSTVITASWKNPEQSYHKYNHVLVAALTSNTTAKLTVENEMASILGANINVVKSIDEFPANMTNSDSDEVVIMNKVKNKNINAILTVSLIDKETQSRYIPDSRYGYDPMGGFGYYGNFWGYYNYWYPYAYAPGYYIQDKIYFIETNLYDVSTEKLVWSAQSKTYDPTDLKTFSKDFAATIVAKMKKDGVLNEIPQSPQADR
jgi:hypothetical protein